MRSVLTSHHVVPVWQLINPVKIDSAMCVSNKKAWKYKHTRIGDDAGWRGGPLAWQVLIGNWNHILCPKFFNCWYYCIYSCVESDKKVFFGQTNEVMRVRCAWSKCPIVKYYCPPRFMVRRHSIQPGEYCVCSKYFYRDITFFSFVVMFCCMSCICTKTNSKPGLTNSISC